MQRPRLLILNGPGLQASELDQVRRHCDPVAASCEVEMEYRVARDVLEMASWIDQCEQLANAVIINPGENSAESADNILYYREPVNALANSGFPAIELHLTNPFLAVDNENRVPLAEQGKMGLICGFGIHGYTLAIRSIARQVGGAVAS